jgi:hypothetical protein
LSSTFSVALTTAGIQTASKFVVGSIVARSKELYVSRQLGKWMLGLVLVVLLAGAVTPAEAQVVVRFGHRHHYRHHHHRHYYYRHGHRYWR